MGKNGGDAERNIKLPEKVYLRNIELVYLFTP